MLLTIKRWEGHIITTMGVAKKAGKPLIKKSTAVNNATSLIEQIKNANWHTQFHSSSKQFPPLRYQKLYSNNQICVYNGYTYMSHFQAEPLESSNVRSNAMASALGSIVA